MRPILPMAAALSLLAAPAMARDGLVIGVAQFPANLHPYIGSQTVQQYVVGLSLRRITTFDSTGAIVCLLCTQVPSLENGLVRREPGADGHEGLAVTLRLRPGLAWGDGVPVTAHDVAFTWRLGRNPDAGFANAHPWTRASSVDVVDEHTAVLHLPRTDTSFALWDEVLPEHVEGPVLDAAHAPGDYITTTRYNRDPTNPGLWDGPFVVSDYQSNAAVGFTPNPHWPGPAPGLHRITVRLIENTTALEANLLSGDVDMTPSGIGLTIDQAMSLGKRADAARLRVLWKPQLTYEHVDMSLANPVLQDERVRRALRLGVDVATIVDRLLGGHAEVARSFINGLDPHYTPDVPTYAYDPGQARRLLDEAGWIPGADGIRRDAHGGRLSLDFATTSGNRARELTQQVMQSQWRAIGVEVLIRNQPSRTFFGQLLKHREFTGLAEYASTGEVDLVPWSRLSTPFIPSAANTWGGQNYAGVSDPALDTDIAAAQYELDPARQQALWTDMQRRYAQHLYSLPLYYRVDADVLPTWLGGYTATGRESTTTCWAEDWHG